MNRLSPLALCALTMACSGARAPSGPTVSVHVAPLTLTGVTDADWGLRVVNAGGTEVFNRPTLLASAFGNGDDLAFVGPCDADPTKQPNRVELRLNGLYDAGGLIAPATYRNPTSAGPLVQSITCQPNADVAVTFDVTVARDANQGFFDLAVTFEDIFCSAKLDCTRDAAGAPNLLVFDPDTNTRLPTTVLAFACTAGAGRDTHLYLDGIVIACDSASYTIDVSAGPGNLFSASSGSNPAPVGAPFAQVQLFRGFEALTDMNGVSWSKLYWNTAIGLDLAGFGDSCTLTTTATASDGALTDFATRTTTTYPVVRYALSPFIEDGVVACRLNSLDGNGSDVTTGYTTLGAAERFDHALRKVGGDVSTNSYLTPCGDGNRSAGEACDDGDLASGDGCSEACTVELGFQCVGSQPSACASTCGDGVRAFDEGCDDDDLANDDGCTDVCEPEFGYECVGMPSQCTTECGDGDRAASEDCDDGNDDSGDGCAASCSVELGYGCSGNQPSSCLSTCPDGVRASDEGCDDNNSASGDGCSPACTVELGYTCVGSAPSMCSSTCGDGVKVASEACDDADNDDGDGCSASCTVEYGFACAGTTPSVCTSTLITVTRLLSGRASTTCLAQGGLARCWGQNNQLQTGQPGGGSAFAPFTLSGLPPVAEAQGGIHGSCARGANGTIWCWGNGASVFGGSATPQQRAGISTATQLEVGDEAYCILLGSGVVNCFGINNLGQLGGHNLTGVSQIAVNDHHACARLTTGGLRCWGRNNDGQLGKGSTSPTCGGGGDNCETGVVTVVGISDALAVFVGHNSACARFAAAPVKCWGNNETGQLGTGAVGADQLSPVVASALPTRLVQMAMGFAHACGVTDIGDVYCWGARTSGKIGDGSTSGNALVPFKVNLPPATEVTVGSNHSCARLTTGAVRCWGDDTNGQCGDTLTTPTTNLTPVTVSGTP